MDHKPAPPRKERGQGFREGKGPNKRFRKSQPRPPTIKDIQRQAIEKLATELNIPFELAISVHQGTVTAQYAQLLCELGKYKTEHYRENYLEQAFANQTPLQMAIYGHNVITGLISEMSRYEFSYLDVEKTPTTIRKLEIKFFYTDSPDVNMQKLIKADEKVQTLGLKPIEQPSARNHIKNKVLYPLMQSREVIFFTTMEGDVIRGIVGSFNRYEIIIHMKGGMPIILMRHAIYDIRDKTGKICYLKHQSPRTGGSNDGIDPH